MSSDLAQQANDRYEIVDTLHRYAFGLDHGDADSLASAFTEDCLLDFRPAGRKLGIDFPRLTGRQAIVDALLPLLGPLDTKSYGQQSPDRDQRRLGHTVCVCDVSTFHAAGRFSPRFGERALDEPLRLRAGARWPEMALQACDD